MIGLQANTAIVVADKRPAAIGDEEMADSRSTFIQTFGFDAQKLGDFAKNVAQLTRMQRKIMMFLVQGKLNKEIAYACDISVATVKAHSTKVFEKLKTRTRAETAAKFAVYLLLYE